MHINTNFNCTHLYKVYLMNVHWILFLYKTWLYTLYHVKAGGYRLCYMTVNIIKNGKLNSKIKFCLKMNTVEFIAPTGGNLHRNKEQVTLSFACLLRCMHQQCKCVNEQGMPVYDFTS